MSADFGVEAPYGPVDNDEVTRVGSSARPGPGADDRRARRFCKLGVRAAVVDGRGIAGLAQGGGVLVPVAMPIQTDWVKSVLFDRGYLARIRGEAIKVYLVMLEACGGRARPERDDQPEPVDDADAAVVPDGDRQPGAAGGPRPGRLDDARAGQGEDLLRVGPPARRSACSD